MDTLSKVAEATFLVGGARNPPSRHRQLRSRFKFGV